MNMKIYYLCLVAIILGLQGCFGSDSGVAEYVDHVKKTAVGKIDQLPQAETYKTQDYAAENLRDPFLPSNTLNPAALAQRTVIINPVSGVAQQPRPDLHRPREILEKYALSSFSMVGTLSKPNAIWGLVKDAAGLLHAVKVGDYIGQNSGYIIDITTKEISIVETVPNGVGGWMQSNTTLTLSTAVTTETKTTTAPKAATVPDTTTAPKATTVPAAPTGTKGNK